MAEALLERQDTDLDLSFASNFSCKLHKRGSARGRAGKGKKDSLQSLPGKGKGTLSEAFYLLLVPECFKSHNSTQRGI